MNEVIATTHSKNIKNGCFKFMFRTMWKNISKHKFVEQIMFKILIPTFLMCLILCFGIFRNPHAQNAWVTQKSAALVRQSHPTSRYVRPISSPQRIEFTWNLREIVMGPPFEAPKMRFLSAFRSDWSSKREIFRLVEFNKFQSLIFSKWMARKIRGK